MCICENNATCSLNSLDPVQLEDCPLVFVDLSNGSLFFVIGSCSPFVFLIILFSLNSLC